jgi:hypothetical protein
VIARVIRLTGGASVNSGFFGSLDSLSTTEESTGRDAHIDEGPVVGSAVKSGRLRREALTLEVAGEDVLDGV